MQYQKCPDKETCSLRGINLATSHSNLRNELEQVDFGYGVTHACNDGLLMQPIR